MIQQPRVRTKTYGDKRFDKTASTFWNNLPSETRNEQSLEIFRENVKIYLFRTSKFAFIIPPL
jgi:hypothetical protein